MSRRHISIDNHNIIKDIQREVLLAQNNGARREVIEWLGNGNSDPSTEHNIARKKFSKDTGSWLLDGNNLKRWLQSMNSFMWLHGGGELLIYNTLYCSC